MYEWNKLEFVFDKAYLRKYKIIHYLYRAQDGKRTLNELSLLCEVSKKTVRAMLKTLVGDEIFKKSGISLNFENNNSSISVAFPDDFSLDTFRFAYLEASLSFQVLKAAFYETLNVQEMAKINFFSYSVIYKHINMLKKELQPFGVKLLTKDTFRIVGDELKIRLFYMEVLSFIYGNKKPFIENEKSNIKDYLETLKEKQNPLRSFVTDTVENRLYYFYFVSVTRIKKKHVLLEIPKFLNMEIDFLNLVQKEFEPFISSFLVNSLPDEVKEREHSLLIYVTLLLVENAEVTQLFSEEMKYKLATKYTDLKQGAEDVETYLQVDKKEAFQMNLYYEAEKQLVFKSQNKIQNYLDPRSQKVYQVIKELDQKSDHNISQKLQPLTLQDYACQIIRYQKPEYFKMFVETSLGKNWNIVIFNQVMTLELAKQIKFTDQRDEAKIILSDQVTDSSKPSVLIATLPSEPEIFEIQNELKNIVLELL